MRTLKCGNVQPTSLSAAAFAALLAVVACSGGSETGQARDNGGSAEQSGSLGLSLQLASGDFVASVSYAIIGPNGFSKAGTIDVSSSDTLLTTIAALPVGSGFSIALNATSSNRQAQCVGSASFNVLAHQTTSVAVPLVCRQAPRAGSVAINGSVNVCPALDAINAAPSEVAVGSSLSLSAAAHDSDAGPAPLAYTWIASDGTLNDAHSATPRFTCLNAGPATLSVTVSDGDPTAGCADVGSVTVTCVSTSSGAGGSAGTGGGSAGAPAGGGGASGAGAGAGAGGAGAGAGGTGAGAAGSSGGGSPSNLVVYRVGDGVGSLVNTGNPVFMDEFTSAGVLVRSTAMPSNPIAGSHRLVASGTATSEGLISRSANGKYVVLAGYDSVLPASASLAGTASATVPRTIARLDASGALDTTTGLSDAATGNSPRSVVSSDGVSLWLTGGAGGVRFTTLGASTSTQLSTTVANLRQAAIFGSQLFVSDASGSAVRLGAVGVGLPTTTGQSIVNLPGVSATTGSPYGFVLVDLDPATPGVDVLYVADDGAGIIKYSLLSGVWTTNSTLGTAADAYRGLSATVSGSTVSLYATRKGGSTATGGGELVQITDSSGYNGALSATPTLLATAATNTAFRGVALTPQP